MIGSLLLLQSHRRNVMLAAAALRTGVLPGERLERRVGTNVATRIPLPFGALLRRNRVLAGMTQEELARRAGLSVRAISDLERGVNRSPQPATLLLLGEALQLSTEERAFFEETARTGRLAAPPAPTSVASPEAADVSQLAPYETPSHKFRLPLYWPSIEVDGPGRVILIVAIFVGLTVGTVQFLHFTHMASSTVPKASAKSALGTRTGEPIILESSYSTASPLCDASTGTLDLTWDIDGVNYSCLPQDNGTLLMAKGFRQPGFLILNASLGHVFAPNQTITSTFTKLGAQDCAALYTRGAWELSGYRQYAFYICGNGDWYIVKYSNDLGTPEILAQSGVVGLAYPIATAYEVVITVDGAHLSMSVNSGTTYSITDAAYTTSEAIGVDVIGEVNIATPLPATTLASVLVSNFWYQAF
jgi:transcriptional regulator with XRE-family HTH domain